MEVKIASITHQNGTTSYLYDAGGNRVRKTHGSTTTYYVRDAQGNVMATYKNNGEGMALIERPLYGSSRVGMDVRPVTTRNTTQSDTGVFTRYLTQKQYELSDHLGNVRTVVKDVKYNVNSTYVPDIASYQNYYAFGMLQEERMGSASTYRYGYNGKEKDDEVKGEGNSLDYGARVYDSQVARFLSLDPQQKRFAFFSPYIYAANTPIQAVDQDGKFAYWIHFKITYLALTKAGIDKQTAAKVARFASVYADHPDSWIVKTSNNISAFLDNAESFLKGQETIPYDLSIPEKDDILWQNSASSQSDEMIAQGVTIHAMMARWENITEEEAVDRALLGGTFLEKNGDKVTIEGALPTLKRLFSGGRKISDFSDNELSQMGHALHTLQDAQIHKGKRWADEGFGKIIGKMLFGKQAVGAVSDHPDADCTAGVGSDEAQDNTESLVRFLNSGGAETP